MEKQEREEERKRGASCEVQLTVVDRGRETKLNQKSDFYTTQPSPRSITLAGRPAGGIFRLFRMSPKSISSLALPRSTLFALSQAGYETTDELASSTPENLARGKSALSDQQSMGHSFLMGILSSLA